MSKAKDVEKRYREIMVGRSVDERAVVIFGRQYGKGEAWRQAMAEIASNEQRLFEDPEHAFRTAAEAIGAERAREILGEMAPQCAFVVGRTEMATLAAAAFGLISGAYKPMMDQFVEVRGLAQPPLTPEEMVQQTAGIAGIAAKSGAGDLKVERVGKCPCGPNDACGACAPSGVDHGPQTAVRPKYADRLRQIRQEKGE